MVFKIKKSSFKIRDSQKLSKIFCPYLSIYIIKALLSTNSMVKTRVHLDLFLPSYGYLKGKGSVKGTWY